MSLFFGRNRYSQGIRKAFAWHSASYSGAARSCVCAKSGKTCFTCSFLKIERKTFFLLQLDSTATFIFSVWSLVHTVSFGRKKVRHLSRLEMTTTTLKTETKFAKMWTLRRYRWPLSKFNTALTSTSNEIIRELYRAAICGCVVV